MRPVRIVNALQHLMEGNAMDRTETAVTESEKAVHWKDFLCNICKAIGFSGGLIICGLQLATAVGVIGIIIYIIFF